MAVSPTCQVRDGAGSFVATTDGVNVTPGNTITVRLADTTDVVDWFLVVLGTDETTTTPALTGVNPSTNKVTTPGTLATFPMPSGAGRAVLIESTVTGPGGPQVTTLAVFTLTTHGYRIGATGEQREGSTGYGWATKLNPLIRSGAPVLRYDDSLALPTLGVSTIQQAIDALKAASGGFTAAGDLAGDGTSQTVIGWLGIPLDDSVAPEDQNIWSYDIGSGKFVLVPFPSGSFTAAGDLSGDGTSQTVIGFQGRPVSAAAPSFGNVYKWGGSEWIPGEVSGTITVQQIGGGSPPPITGVTTIRFASSTVSDDGGGVVTVTPSGGGGGTTVPLDQGRSVRQAQSWGVMADRDLGSTTTVLVGGGSSTWTGCCWDGRAIWAIENDGGLSTNRLVKAAPFSGGGLGGYELSKNAAGLGLGSFDPIDVCYDGNDVWVSDATGKVYRISRTSGSLQSTVTLASVNRLEFDGEAVWVSRGSAGITRITLSFPTYPTTNLVVGGGAQIEHMVFDGRYLWCSALDQSTLYKVEPFGTPSLQATPALSHRARALCFDGTYVWAVSDTGKRVFRVHSETGTVDTLDLATYFTGSGPTAIGFDGRIIYVASGGEHVRINPMAMRVLRGETISIGATGPLRPCGDGFVMGQGGTNSHAVTGFGSFESKRYSRVETRRGPVQAGAAYVELGFTLSGVVTMTETDGEPEEAMYIVVVGALSGNTRIQPATYGPWIIDNQITHNGHTLTFGQSGDNVALTEGAVHHIGRNPFLGQFKVLFQNP